MKALLIATGLLFGLTTTAAWAQAPTGAPAGTTGLCKDGSYTSNATRKGACRGHQGVKEWYAAAPAEGAAAPAEKKGKHHAKEAAPAAAAAPAEAPKPAPAPAAMPAPAAAPAAAASPHMATHEAAPGGGAGKVWVNSETKVYHCPNDRYYGKTKHGEYMSEADAVAKGNHAAHGKACAQ